METSTWAPGAYFGSSTVPEYGDLVAGNATGESPALAACYPGERLSSGLVAAVTAAYALIFFFGVTGNALVAVVIWNNADMRSSTNYFLVNLSVADLMVLLVCMPPPLMELFAPDVWLLGKFMCYLVSVLDSATAHASILTLLAISIERYYVICMPFKANYTCTSKRTLIICCLVWLIAFLSSVPVVLLTGYRLCLDPASGDLQGRCEAYASTKLQEAYMGGIFCLFFLLPFGFMTVIYCIIANTLRMHDNYMAAIRKKESPGPAPGDPGAPTPLSSSPRDAGRLVELASLPRRSSAEYLMESNSHPAPGQLAGNHVPGSQSEEPLTVATVEGEEADHRYAALRPEAPCGQAPGANAASQSLANAATRQSHRRVVLMLASVVVVFFVCWFPMRIVMLWQIFAPTESVYAWLVAHHHAFVVMLAGFRVLIYINSAINPILYNLISTKFRAAFRSVIRCEDARRSRSKRSISTRSFTSTSSLRVHSRTTDYHG